MNKYTSFSVFFLAASSAVLWSSCNLSSTFISCAVSIVLFMLLMRFPRLIEVLKYPLAIISVILVAFEWTVTLTLSVRSGLEVTELIVLAATVVYLCICGEKVLLRLSEIVVWFLPVCVAVLLSSLSNTTGASFPSPVSALSSSLSFVGIFSCAACLTTFTVPRKGSAVAGFACGCIITCVCSLMNELLFYRIDYHIHPLLTAARICDIPALPLAASLLFVFFAFRSVVFVLCAYKCIRKDKKRSDRQNADRENDKGHTSGCTGSACKSEH